MNWHERIDKAIERGKFKAEDRDLSANWPDCACGEQDPRIPRDDCGGHPLDRALFNLGCDFYDAVHHNDFDRAKMLLTAIEKRAARVIAEQEKLKLS